MAATHKDPVCGMDVAPAEAAGTLERDGQTYYFCSEHCRQKFQSATPARTATGMYTCPMHPEIRQDHPGSCPQCGMDLEPVEPTGERKVMTSPATCDGGLGSARC